MSVRRGEAAKRIRNIEAALDALNIPHEPGGEPNTIRLIGRGVRFVVLAANYRTAVGDTSFLIWADEVARWISDTTSRNPAEDVIGSISPTIATLPDARMFLVSSPLGADDYHAQRYDMGDANGQRVYFAPTWIGNPTLSKARTKELEPDPKKWAREYAAVPQAAVTAAFDADDVEAAIVARTEWPRGQQVSRAAFLDMSGGRGDATVCAIGGWHHPPNPLLWTPTKLTKIRPGVWMDRPNPDPKPTQADFDADFRPYFAIEDWRTWSGKFGDHMTAEELLDQIATFCGERNVRGVFADPYSAYFVTGGLQRRGLNVKIYPWSNATKGAAVERLRYYLRERRLRIAMANTRGDSAEEFQRELNAYEERITGTSLLAYSGRRGVHDDHVAALLVAMMADANGLHGSPTNELQPYTSRIDVDRLPSY
ncbi:MAG: hypothetical protein R3B72_01360 [Polyangiaceae bacterium]